MALLTATFALVLSFRILQMSRNKENCCRLKISQGKWERILQSTWGRIIKAIERIKYCSQHFKCEILREASSCHKNKQIVWNGDISAIKASENSSCELWNSSDDHNNIKVSVWLLKKCCYVLFFTSGLLNSVQISCKKKEKRFKCISLILLISYFIYFTFTELGLTSVTENKCHKCSTVKNVQ